MVSDKIDSSKILFDKPSPNNESLSSEIVNQTLSIATKMKRKNQKSVRGKTEISDDLLLMTELKESLSKVSNSNANTPANICNPVELTSTLASPLDIFSDHFNLHTVLNSAAPHYDFDPSIPQTTSPISSSLKMNPLLFPFDSSAFSTPSESDDSESISFQDLVSYYSSSSHELDRDDGTI